MVIREVSKLVKPLAAALGPRVEVVLHDLSLLPDSIVAVGGSITGRRDGGPGSDLLLKRLRQGNYDDLIGYESVSTTGEKLKSSSVFLRNDAGVAIACLCINTDVSRLSAARDALDLLLSTVGSADSAAVPEQSSAPAASSPLAASSETEVFAYNVEQLSDLLLQRAVESVGVLPHKMRKAHKVAVVSDLDDRGFFLLRDSVETAAERLNVTRYTIYNYLNEIREGSPGPRGSARWADRVPPHTRSAVGSLEVISTFL